MPCDQIRTITVEFGVGTDIDLLKKAGEVLGYQVTVNQENTNRLDFFKLGTWKGMYEAGKITLNEREINPLKKAYSVQIVESSARRFGWQAKKQGEAKYALQKRGF